MDIVPAVKKFIEEHIEEIETSQIEYILRKAYIQFLPYAFDQFLEILDQVIDSDLTKIKDNLLLEIIDNYLAKYITANTNNLTIGEFIYIYLPTTLLFDKDHVIKLIIANAERWPHMLKFNKRNKEWIFIK